MFLRKQLFIYFIFMFFVQFLCTFPKKEKKGKKKRRKRNKKIAGHFYPQKRCSQNPQQQKNLEANLTQQPTHSQPLGLFPPPKTLTQGKIREPTQTL